MPATSAVTQPTGQCSRLLGQPGNADLILHERYPSVVAALTAHTFRRMRMVFAPGTLKIEPCRLRRAILRRVKGSRSLWRAGSAEGANLRANKQAHQQATHHLCARRRTRLGRQSLKPRCLGPGSRHEQQFVGTLEEGAIDVVGQSCQTELSQQISCAPLEPACMTLPTPKPILADIAHAETITLSQAAKTANRVVVHLRKPLPIAERRGAFAASTSGLISASASQRGSQLSSGIW